MSWRRRATLVVIVIALLCLVALAACLYFVMRPPVDMTAMSGSWVGREERTGAKVSLKLRPDGTYEKRVSDFRKLPENAGLQWPEKVHRGTWSIVDDEVVLHDYVVLEWFWSDSDSGTAEYRVVDEYELRIARGLLARWDVLKRVETIRFNRTSDE